MSEKTKKKLAYTLIQLLNTNSLDTITIKKLCQYAHVSRTTFYKYFRKIEDVLIYSFNSAHNQAFGDKDWDLNYLKSDKFIHDIIRFFDENSILLETLYKWNILDYVTGLIVHSQLKYAKESNHPFISKYPYYAISYFWGNYFKICSCWICNGKKESVDELYQIIKTLNTL